MYDIVLSRIKIVDFWGILDRYKFEVKKKFIKYFFFKCW